MTLVVLHFDRASAAADVPCKPRPSSPQRRRTGSGEVHRSTPQRLESSDRRLPIRGQEGGMHVARSVTDRLRYRRAWTKSTPGAVTEVSSCNPLFASCPQPEREGGTLGAQPAPLKMGLAATTRRGRLCHERQRGAQARRRADRPSRSPKASIRRDDPRGTWRSARGGGGSLLAGSAPAREQSLGVRWALQGRSGAVQAAACSPRWPMGVAMLAIGDSERGPNEPGAPRWPAKLAPLRP